MVLVVFLFVLQLIFLSTECSDDPEPACDNFAGGYHCLENLAPSYSLPPCDSAIDH